MNSVLRFVVFVLITSVMPTQVLAKNDVAGSKDHPLISRYANSHIKQYSMTDFDEMDIATGPRSPSQQRPPVKTVEGKVTTIIYETNTNTESLIKVFKNYTHSLKRAGFKKIFTCTDATCGHDFVMQLIVPTHRKAQYLRIDPWNTNARFSNYRYWSGSLKKGDKQVYASLLVKIKSSSKYPAEIALDIVETKSMELDLVTIDVNTLTESINTTGKAVLKGIFFDHDQDIVKPESQASMDVIANYLSKNPSVNVYIVGHTDNTGSDLHNNGLSKRRADAVVLQLIKKYGIQQKRLLAHGLGPLAPVTTNKTDEGRAENRRVEIVLRSR